MRRKSKDKKEELILDFESFPIDESEDLLAEKNKAVLANFGDNISENNNPFYPSKTETEHSAASPLDSLKSRMGVEETKGIKETKKHEPTAEKSVPEKTLLEKLKRYTTDETGHNVTEDEAPLYTLKSVAEIIKSDSSKLLDRLSEKYDVTIDTLGKSTNDDYLPKESEEQKEDKAEDSQKTEKADASGPTPTPAFEKMSVQSKQRFEKNLFDDLFPKETEEPPKDESVPDISDIDNSHIASHKDEPLSNTATIRFTPIKDEKGNTGRINISSSTKVIDINQELTNTSEAEEADNDNIFETNDFDLFIPRDEATDFATAKSISRKLAYKKRRNFISVAVCSLCTLVMLLFLTPILSDKVISATKSVIILCTSLFGFEILANADMFADLLNVFRRKASHDCVISLCAIFGIVLCVSAIVTGENVYHLILLMGILMFTRSVITFMQTSALASNLNKIRSSVPKNAVAFIKDGSTALAMAKNAIDGDVLIAAPRKAEFINDFMKFSLYKKKLSGKMPIVFIAALVLSLLGAVMAYFYYKTAFAAIYTVSVTTIILSMPALMFIDALPLFCAAKTLNKKGAMIAGTFGADNIELANAAVIETNDIFPNGTVILKSFKVLSDNNIDSIIVNAAALTEEIGSPLAPIFGKIAGTSTSYKKPDSDTIKYEERLGISGWVNDELLFIGNRTLMQAHGIEVPSIEVDKRILRKGCFPVYVGAGGKACALVVIQYEVRSDIRKLLRKISQLGITMLVKNCDPNVNEEMICDYFGLYDDSVKVMTNVGVHMYENAVTPVSMISAPASFKGSRLNLLRIMNSASRIRISNNILSIFYVLTAVFGIWYFAFTSFAQSSVLLSGATLLLFELLATALGITAFLFKKP